MRDTLFKLAGALLIVATAVGGWFLLEFRAFTVAPLAVPERGAIIRIAPGSSVKQVSNQLYQRGMLSHPTFFAWFARWQGSAEKIRAGEYLIEPNTTVKALLEQLVAGQVLQYGLTVVEGWTFAQLRRALQENEKIIVTLNDVPDDELLEILGFESSPAEGWFLPDTYHFPSGTTDKEFYRRAHVAMKEFLEQEWGQREPNLPLKTPYEALILASIVEKETAAPAERPLIAGVFSNRLLKNMRLQTDPTVIYGMRGNFDGNIKRRDLTMDTPYNTYTRAGLPPTPIALPSREAISAVLHPDRSGYLYFVARGDGTHYFSASLEEHNDAVRKYQLGRKGSQ